MGHYTSPALYIMPCDYDLSLSADGTYWLDGVINKPDKNEVRPGFEDAGRWSSDGTIVWLKSNYEKKTIKLSVLKRDGAIFLSDGEPFGCSVQKDLPNQPPLRMPVSGTPAADAPVAPPPGIAGR